MSQRALHCLSVIAAGAMLGVGDRPALAAGTRREPHTSAPTTAYVLPLLRTSWTWSSLPSGKAPLPSSHAGLQWYNPRTVQESDLNPALTAEEGADQEHQVLELNVLSPLGEAAMEETDWTGVMTRAPVSVQDVPRFLEIWVNDFHPDHTETSGRLHISLGQINEDAFWEQDSAPNGRLDSEDKNFDARLDFDEDTGLDGLFNNAEPGYDPSTNPDPHGDDYDFDSDDPPETRYARINGMEQNGQGLVGARPDTEDLNRDGYPDFADDYFEVTIDLSDTTFVSIDVPRDYAGDPDVEPDNGWRRFHIPIDDMTLTSVGSASWERIETIRIWVDAMIQPIRLQVGGLAIGSALPAGPALPVALHQNYPNPFNPKTTIPYVLGEDGPARLVVYDLQGRLVRELARGTQFAGLHEAVWDGRDSSGRAVGSGVYFYRLDAGGEQISRRMVLTK